MEIRDRFWEMQRNVRDIELLLAKYDALVRINPSCEARLVIHVNGLELDVALPPDQLALLLQRAVAYTAKQTVDELLATFQREEAMALAAGNSVREAIKAVGMSPAPNQQPDPAAVDRAVDDASIYGET